MCVRSEADAVPIDRIIVTGKSDAIDHQIRNVVLAGRMQGPRWEIEVDILFSVGWRAAIGPVRGIVEVSAVGAAPGVGTSLRRRSNQ